MTLKINDNDNYSINIEFTVLDEEITKYYYQITDNPETPFWVEDDKCYEAGKKLYGKK